MKKLIFAIAMLVAAALPQTTDAQNTEVLGPKLQELSVTVHAGDAQGSGTVFTRGGVNFVLTAGHVVEDIRKVDSVLVGGQVEQNVSFAVVTVVKEIYVDGRSVGSTAVEADVVVYSSADYGDDLALLRLRSKITDQTGEFYPDKLVSVGTDVVHVGSLLGQDGSNSFTTGTYAQVGRTLKDKVYDQTTCPAFPGSSGGGVYLRSTGQYVGTLVRGAGETFNLIVPVRRIRTWAKAHGAEFLFDPKSEDFSHLKLEDKEPLPKERPAFTISLGGDKEKR